MKSERSYPRAVITDKGAFDSLNVVFYDPLAKLYRGYIRGYHNSADPKIKNAVRDIRLIESKDFKTWSEPRQRSPSRLDA